MNIDIFGYKIYILNGGFKKMIEKLKSYWKSRTVKVLSIGVVISGYTTLSGILKQFGIDLPTVPKEVIPLFDKLPDLINQLIGIGSSLLVLLSTIFGIIFRINAKTEIKQ